MSGPPAVRRTKAFIAMLQADGAFVPGWRGLDYGAGFGRVASLMLARGTDNQLDLVDAWDRSMELLERGGFQNRRWRVSEVLRPGEILENTYDFIYSFSVLTHLSAEAFWPNLAALKRGIRGSGTVYFTVRLPDFADHAVKHMYPEKADEIRAALDSEGFWFTPLEKLGGGTVFGTTIVSEERLRDELGSLDYLGQPRGQMQHVYALRA